MIPEHYFPQAAKGGDYASAAKYWSQPQYVAQEKFDGARYIVHKDMSGNVRIYSRHISVKTGKPVDKTLQLMHIASEFKRIAPSGTVFDGEVVAAGESAFNLVTTVTGSDPKTALETQEKSGFLLYKAFDMLAYDGSDITQAGFGTRHASLSQLVSKRRSKPIEFITTANYASGEAAMRELYETIVARGGEGILLKDLHAPYFQGKRHASWIKVKKERTFDVVFMGIEMAKETSIKKGDDEATRSRIAGLAGAIRYGQHIEVEVGQSDGLFGTKRVTELKYLGTVSGFDDKTRQDITNNTDWYSNIGRVFEVRAQQQFSKSGALQNPRFIQWRDDKNASDCVFRKDEG